MNHKSAYFIIGFLITSLFLLSGMSVENIEQRLATDILGIQPTSDSSHSPVITLNAVGDIMLSREVGRRIERADDYIMPFAPTSEITRDADITFGNLETAVLEGREIGAYEMSFRSEPQTLLGLVKGGFDIVSLANNHTYNFGEDGLIQTMKHLVAKDIAYCGAGMNYDDAHTPKVITVRGVRVGFLCYNDTDVVPDSTFASDTHAGTAELISEDISHDVSALHPYVDLLIVSMHSGSEYSPGANTRQIEYAHTAVDAGADIVLGHHPHVLQPVEHYNNGVIFYSLGNFIFDQFGKRQNQSVITHITFNAETGVIDYEFTPVKIINFSQAIVVEDLDEQAEILDQIQS